MKNFQNELIGFKKYIKQIEYLKSTINLLTWDMRINLPKKGISYRSEVLGYLAGELYKLNTSNILKEYIDYFTTYETLDDITKAMINKFRNDYHYITQIPEIRYKEYAAATLEAEALWEEAKIKSDFSLFCPYLKKQFEFKKEFIEYWGCKENKYDTLLRIYEPGMTVKKLDALFNELKIAIVKLLNMIKNSKVEIHNELFNQYCPKEKQKILVEHILSKVGFDFERGWLGESLHPVTTVINRQDVRITTHYYENEFQRALISSIHEGGHAINEQNIPADLEGTMLGTAPSDGISESQSRFYENMIGRSKEFWTYFLPDVKKILPHIGDIKIEEFYKGINKVKPSTNRLAADELTYSLHIIIRYELEKAIINEDIEVEDLPALWNEKYKEYLGIEPENDAEGILQDMHWGSGLIGYFPSYALGNLYDGMFLNKMKKDIPNVFERIRVGEFDVVLTWLKNNIHKFGSIYEPEELVKKATGEKLTAKYFIDYLNEKYKEIYDL